jgi:serine/threonine-protein kinase
VQDVDGRDLCLKLIAPNYSRDRLDREIEALQTIQHPNVVKLHEYVFASRNGEQEHYFVEEFVEGNDLADCLTGVAWPLPKVVKFFSALSQGLGTIGMHGIVHRDLKPTNIRVRPTGDPVIIDFGLARHLNKPDLTGTIQGARIGTPKYFAPEQFLGSKRDIDQRTDLFALGVMMYEATVGIHPFASGITNWAELETAVCKSTVHSGDARFTALPQELRLLIQRLLSKSRAQRPMNAFLVADLLGCCAR